MSDCYRLATSLHQSMGDDLVKLGGILRCKVCGNETEALTAEQIASYLARGWPRCCSHTMEWLTQKQLDEEIEMKLTKAEVAAIEYLGSHRKSRRRVGNGKSISTRIFNQLKRKHLVMWLDEENREAMLTYLGEREWTKLHPYSKYKIK